MPMYKCTMIFQQVSPGATTSPVVGPDGRIAGWSESWYRADVSAQMALAIMNDANGLCESRAALLNTSAAVVGQRVQQVSPVGATLVGTTVFGSPLKDLADIPQMSISCYMQGKAAVNRRRVSLRGIPDSKVVGGGYVRAAAFTANLGAFYKSLDGYSFPGHDKSVAGVKVLAVDANGRATLDKANPFAVNTPVRVTRIKELSSGDTRHFSTVVTAQIAPNIVQLDPNRAFIVGLGGRMDSDVVLYFLVDPQEVPIPKITTRKVGRPFDSYRGRR